MVTSKHGHGASLGDPPFCFQRQQPESSEFTLEPARDRRHAMQDQLQQIGIVAIAGALGAIVGFEREFADKPAGLRTHIFVGAASAMLMLLGDGVLDQFQQEDRGGLSADPIRIIQAIVVGISFLGAGTIIHHQDKRVEGLTTAASILLTAGIGIAVAVGQLIFAVSISILAVLVLTLVGGIERRIARHVRKRTATRQSEFNKTAEGEEQLEHDSQSKPPRPLQ